MLAELVGWTLTEEKFFKVIRAPGETTTGFCCGKHLTDAECWLFEDRLPRYTQSLDECARVEAGLTDEQWVVYTERHLLSQALKMPRKSHCLVSASARQRTIALISTLQAKP